MIIEEGTKTQFRCELNKSKQVKIAKSYTISQVPCFQRTFVSITQEREGQKRRKVHESIFIHLKLIKVGFLPIAKF